MIQLQAVARGGRLHALEAAREALSEAGAWLVDLRLFSDHSACLTLEVPTGTGLALARALDARSIALDEPSRTQLAAIADAEVNGTLVLFFAGATGDLRGQIPEVPG